MSVVAAMHHLVASQSENLVEMDPLVGTVLMTHQGLDHTRMKQLGNIECNRKNRCLGVLSQARCAVAFVRSFCSANLSDHG